MTGVHVTLEKTNLKLRENDSSSEIQSNPETATFVNPGHSAVIHGCTVEDEAFVGMGATLFDGVVVEKHAMVAAAGSLVRENTRISSVEVWGGNPAKFMRKLTDEEIADISKSAENYINLAHIHAAENSKSFDEIEVERALRKKYAHKDEDYDSMLGIVTR